jgi:16S rRNA (uracil1498-N3)-methyltransferase
MANPRLMINTALAAGVEVALDDSQARHVGVVLRLGEGDTLRVFNAPDGEWAARVVARKKRGMSVRVEHFIRPARPPADLDLLFAPVKRHATDLIVEKATELGVRRIRPVLTQRTIAETVRLERLNAIAREAAEQTERFDAPEILEPLSLAKALDGWDAARMLIYADEAGDEVAAPGGGEGRRAAPLLEALQEGAKENGAVATDPARPPPPAAQGGRGSLALLVGPEGGFTTEERRMLRALPYVMPVSLGPRILRAETAAIAALSVIQACWGDWRNG